MSDWGLHEVMVRLGHHVTALDTVSLPVTPGTVAAVVGGDGAGKSTVVRTLTRRVAPVAGRVVMPAPDRIGAVFDASGVWGDLTVAENLTFVAQAYGVPDAETTRRCDRLLDLAGLADTRARRADRLSGGMRQKLAVVAAMLPAPDVVVLDEPTTGVDPVSRAELWRLLAGAAADGAAVVMTTTYLDEAERASHLLVLDGGRPVVDGTPADVVDAATGHLVETAERLDDSSWRHGRQWRTWCDGAVPAGARDVVPHLEDVVIRAQQDGRDRGAVTA